MLRRLLFLPLLLLAAAACDPCTGVGACSAPHVRYEGVLTRKFGTPQGPAEGVTVRFIRTGGVELESDTLEARSDEEGRFRLEGRARGEGQVMGDLVIYPPGPVEPVRNQGLRLATSRAAGEVLRLGEWKIPFPHMAYAGYVYYRSTGQPAVGIEAVFRRTGGLRIDPDTFRITADPRGFLLIRPVATEYGEVTGDLTVYPPPPYKEINITGLRLRTSVTEQSDSTIRIGIGYRLPYSIILVWSNTGQGAEGVEVEYVRTGGVPIAPARYVTRTDRFGTAYLVPTPLESGEVVGDLIIRPPAPGRGFTIRDFRLKTVEDDRALELLGFYGIPVEAP